MSPVKKKLLIFLLVAGIAMLLGCSHKTLTVFFDNVPDSDGFQRKRKIKTEQPSDTIRVVDLAYNSTISNNSSHPPFANKKCRVCHDPERKGVMIEAQPGLCYQCHDRIKQKFEHGPVASGSCTLCHSPHSSDNPKLLLQTGQALCLNCHESGRLALTAEHDDIDKLPCTECHNPHGGDKRFFLK
jgi:predicted CXXCH cytochrome family protein